MVQELVRDVVQVVHNIVAGDSIYPVREAYLFCALGDAGGLRVPGGIAVIALCDRELTPDAQVWERLTTDDYSPSALLMEHVYAHPIVAEAVAPMLGDAVRQGMVKRKDVPRLRSRFEAWTRDLPHEGKFNNSVFYRPSLATWMGYPTDLVNLEWRSLRRNVVGANVATVLERSSSLEELIKLRHVEDLCDRFVRIYSADEQFDVAAITQASIESELANVSPEPVNKKKAKAPRDVNGALKAKAPAKKSTKKATSQRAEKPQRAERPRRRFKVESDQDQSTQQTARKTRSRTTKGSRTSKE